MWSFRIRELTSQKIGTLLRISGQVVRTHPVHPELVTGTFICLDCQTVIKDVEQQFKYTQVCGFHRFVPSIVSFMKLWWNDCISLSRKIRQKSFFRLSFHNFKSCVYNGDDHPSFHSSLLSSHIWCSYIQKLHKKFSWSFALSFCFP